MRLKPTNHQICKLLLKSYREFLQVSALCEGVLGTHILTNSHLYAFMYFYSCTFLGIMFI